MRATGALLLPALFLSVLGCSGRSGGGTDRYANPALWLCNPALDPGGCRDDLTATAVLADGRRTTVPHVPTASSAFDCFYVYPTVDLTGPVGNHTDFSNLGPIRSVYKVQAEPFDALCPVYAPLYRQITILTYFTADPTPFLQIAYQDVADAFDAYLHLWNHGRPFVLLAHSQGSTMLRMLLQNEFDRDPALRKRLIAALLIGGDVVVPMGKTVGATFQNLPLCLSDAETGCVLTYRSYAQGSPPNDRLRDYAAGTDPACTNPADLAGGGPALFSGSLFPTAFAGIGATLSLVGGVSTPFALYPDFYSGRCTRDAAGFSYLEIATAPAPGDLRTAPFAFDQALGSSFLGLHVLDYNFPMEDLIRLVDVKSRAWLAAR